MIKVLSVKYPTVIDVDMQRKVKPVLHTTDAQNIQHLIKNLLFQDNCNYLLISMNNKLYVCEVVDEKKKLYSYREICYHPFMNEINAS